LLLTSRPLVSTTQQSGDGLESATRALKGRDERRKWAEAQLDELEAGKVEALRVALSSGRRLDARFTGGELRLLADGTPILFDIFLSDEAGLLTEAYWRWLLQFASARLRDPTRTPSVDGDLEFFGSTKRKRWSVGFYRGNDELAGQETIASLELNDRRRGFWSTHSHSSASTSSIVMPSTGLPYCGPTSTICRTHPRALRGLM
jgi:hypothetical protein